MAGFQRLEDVQGSDIWWCRGFLARAVTLAALAASRMLDGSWVRCDAKRRGRARDGCGSIWDGRRCAWGEGSERRGAGWDDWGREVLLVWMWAHVGRLFFAWGYDFPVIVS